MKTLEQERTPGKPGPRPKGNEHKLQFYLTKELHAELERYADAHDQSIGAVLRELVTKLVKKGRG